MGNDFRRKCVLYQIDYQQYAYGTVPFWESQKLFPNKDNFSLRSGEVKKEALDCCEFSRLNCGDRKTDRLLLQRRNIFGVIYSWLKIITVMFID